MISKDWFTDQEWAEFISRCEIITKQAPAVHEYELGDWFLNKDRVLLQTTPPGVTHGYDPDEVEYVMMEQSIWIPRLDQLVRMEGWSYPNLIRRIVDDPLIPDELAGLRSLQRCPRSCEIEFQQIEGCEVCSNFQWDGRAYVTPQFARQSCIERNSHCAEKKECRIMGSGEFSSGLWLSDHGDVVSMVGPGRGKCLNCNIPLPPKLGLHGQCAGIHPPDGPHRCLDHALGLVRGFKPTTMPIVTGEDEVSQ